MDLDMPGYFLFNGQPFGYTYDLLDAYAQSRDMTLQVVSRNTPHSYPELLAGGRLDMVGTLHSSTLQEDLITVPLYETAYVILASKKAMRSVAADTPWSDKLGGRKVLISQGFTATQSYHEMLDSVPDAHFTRSSRNTFELLEGLINGRFDFFICEQSEAQLGCALIRNIETVHRFDETVPVCMLLGKNQPEEGRRFVSWLYDFRGSDGPAELQALYFGEGIYQRIISGGIKNRREGSLSVYDELFQKVAAEENLDWRLVSAIAYSESKYNAYLVSPRGARGLMQVMPATAKAFGISTDELMDPETNVRVAVQLIRRIEQSLKFSAGTPVEERNRIVLACYNGGIGHVADARRLASKHGANPDSWNDVSQYLRLKSQPEYAEDEVVKCGAFNGAPETINFVNHVSGKYRSYCGKVTLTAAN